MECEDVLANLSNYVDGEVSAELRLVLEEHVAKCGPCRVVFDTTEKALKIYLIVGNAMMRIASGASGILVALYLADLADRGFNVSAALVGTLGAVSIA